MWAIGRDPTAADRIEVDGFDKVRFTAVFPRDAIPGGRRVFGTLGHDLLLLSEGPERLVAVAVVLECPEPPHGLGGFLVVTGVRDERAVPIPDNGW